MAVDKTKFKPVEGMTTDGTWPEKGQKLAVGASIEGRLIEVKSDIGKHESKIYVIETADGKKIGVWGSTVLDTKLGSVAIGKMVAVEFLGERPTKDGSGTYKDFFVGEGIDVVGDEIPS